MFCDEATKVKLGEREAYLRPLLCRRWTCDECAPRRAAALRWKARNGRPNTFITLTVKVGQYDTPEKAAEALVAAWRLIRRRAIQEAGRDPRKRTRPFGAYAPAFNPDGPFGDATRRVDLPNGKFDFIAFFERTEKGWPHLHILARSKWLDSKWLSAQCAELLGSPVVDVKRVQSAKGVARYVTKYVTKALVKFATLKRYYSSRKWDLKPKPPKLPQPLPDVEWLTLPGGFNSRLAALAAAFKCQYERYGPWYRFLSEERKRP